MADRYPKEGAFETIEKQINDVFSNLITQLQTRRDMLLKEIRELKLDFQKKLESQQKTLTELENYKKQLEGMNEKENITSNFVQLSLIPINKQIKDLRDSQITPPGIHFSCNTCNLEGILKSLGKLDYENKAIDYASKRKAKHIIGIPDIVCYIHIDEVHLYVGCGKNISTFETDNWAFDRSYNFGNTLSSIATTKDYCYAISSEVSNETNSKINKFTKDKFQFIKQQFVTGGSNSKKCEFTSIAIPSEDEIFVVDKANNRICVFDPDLFFRRDFGTIILKAPFFILIQENRVIIRDDTKELRLFNKQGEFIRNLCEYKGSSYVNKFLFDSSNNFIYTYNNALRVISPTGKLVHEIKSGIEGSEDVSGCGSMVLYRDNIIVACGATNCIKIF